MNKGRLTGRGRAFCSAGITMVIVGSGLGLPDVTRLGALLLVVVAATWWLARRRMRRLVASRSVQPTVVTAGTRCTVTATISNQDTRRSRFGLARETLDFSLGDSPRFVLPGMAPGEVRKMSYVLQPRQRGEHQIGPIEVGLGDPFGLTTRDLTIAGVDTLVVLPHIVPLGSSHPPGAGAGQEGTTPAMIALHGEEDVSLRTYRDGDDLRKVHWPATAHRGELMVRQLDRPARRSCVLVLDPRRDAHGGHGEHSSFEWAVTALASIAERMSELGYLIHLVTRETVSAGLHVVQLDRGQVQLSLARAALGTTADFESVLNSAHDVAGTGAVIVAVVAEDLSGFEVQLGSLRQPGASALGFRLRTETFGGAPVAGEDTLADVGWRVVDVTADTSVPEAWNTISSRSLVRVGSL